MTTAAIGTLFVLAIMFVVFGGLFAAIDAAYSVLARTDVEELADTYPQRRQQLLAIINDKERHLGTVNFVRVTSETLAAVLITVALGAMFGEVWLTLLVAAVAITIVSFMLVGVSPRSIGSSHASTLVRKTARLVRATRIVLGPIAQALNALGTWMAQGRSTPDEKEKSEQLLSMVDLAAEQDLLEEEEQEIIHSVVEFGETSVREVMVPRTDMVTVDADASVREAFEVLLSSRHSRVPVITGDSDDISGVIHLRDVAWFVHRKPEEAETAPVTRLMKPAQFVPDLQRADDLLRQMQREANHLALVFDEYGGIAGLVTLEDLIEELVGEIHDEHDREDEPVEEVSPGVYRVSSRLEIDEFGELFGRNLDDQDTQTVGGLVAKHLGRLAEEGDIVVISGIEIEVLEVERKKKRVLTLLATWVGEPDPVTGSLEIPVHVDDTQPSGDK